MTPILFILGLALGSFLNVVILRYDPDRFLFDVQVIGGRSHCPSCHTQLRWFELIPVLSFIAQGRRCRVCKAPLNWQYPIVEIIAAFLVLGVPQLLGNSFFFRLAPLPVFQIVLWEVVFLTLLTLSVIDFREHIIPDEANILLAGIGSILILLNMSQFGPTEGSFLKAYALLFGIRNNIFLNHIVGVLIASLFFGALVVLTRGRGMGMGDLKLAMALGLLFGWPDIVVIVGLAFVIGSVVGVFEILRRKKTMKSFVPFGPFLALGSALVFFFGSQIVQFYFSLIPF
jgi:leader peptidase (prepilin peptidase)/N-methyltransferase